MTDDSIIVTVYFSVLFILLAVIAYCESSPKVEKFDREIILYAIAWPLTIPIAGFFTLLVLLVICFNYLWGELIATLKNLRGKGDN